MVGCANVRAYAIVESIGPVHNAPWVEARQANCRSTQLNGNR